MRTWLALAATAVMALGVVACGSDDNESDSGGGGDLSGNIRIDGSSTVAPLSEPAGEQFNEENSGVDVTVGTSGTGGGFEKFCAGETDISNASRPIKKDEEDPKEDESKICAEGGVCLLYTSPSPRDRTRSRMPSSA